MADRLPSWSIIPLVGIALAAAGYYWGRKSAPQREVAGLSDDGQRLAALEREVQGLRAATRRATAESRQALAAQATHASAEAERARASAAELTGDGEDPAVREPVDEEEEERKEKEARGKYLAELSHRVDTEQVDGAWRHQKQPAIEQLIPEHMGPEITSLQATCASTLCRVKLTHPTWPRIPQDRVARFVLNRGPLEGMEIQFDARSEGATTLYFLREAP